MRFIILLTPFFLLASCASVPSGDVVSVIRGRAVIQFEQHEFFECGDSGRVLTISNPEKFRDAVIEADPSDVYYKVEGTISQPGVPGSVGLTGGVLVAKKIEVLTGARLACLSTMQGG